MTDSRVIKGVFGSAKGTKTHRRQQRSTSPCECPRCGRPYMPARPSSVRVVERTDEDGCRTHLELCPDPDCPVSLHGSGPRAPIASRPHDEYTRRAALEALLTSIDEEDTEIYNRTRDLFEDPEVWP